MVKLVGLTGAAGCGKDELANGLAGVFHIDIHHMAGPLKRGLEVMFGLSPSIWDDRVKKEEILPLLGVSPRYLAQTLGTEWGRDLVHPQIWVLIAELILVRKGALIVPDVRFENEAKWIWDQGGILIHIERPGQEIIKENGHSSEAGFDDKYITDRIVNDGTICDLVEKGREILECGFGS